MRSNFNFSFSFRHCLHKFTSLPKALVVCLWLAMSQSSFAQPWYQVELILFSQDFPELAAQGTTEESFPEQINLSYPETLLGMFESEFEQTPALRKLPINDRTMNGDAYAFRVTDGYQLLWHQAWQQPLVDEADAPWIYVEGGDQYEEHHQLEGSIRVHLSRFLHITADLWLTDFSPPSLDQEPFYLSELPQAPELQHACSHFRTQQAETENQVLTEAQLLAEPVRYESWWLPPYGCDLARDQLLQGKPLYAPVSPINPPEMQQISYYTVQAEPGFSSPFNDPTVNGEALPSNEDSVESVGFTENPDGSITDENGLTTLQIPMPQVRIGNAPPAYLPIPEVSLSNEDIAVREIVHVEMDRRMRSQEFHFIDHPRLGMLIRILEVPAPIIGNDQPTETSLN